MKWISPQRNWELQPDIPKNIGCCLLFSESDEFTAKDIIKEYDLELRNYYFERSEKKRIESLLSY